MLNMVEMLQVFISQWLPEVSVNLWSGALNLSEIDCFCLHPCIPEVAIFSLSD